MKQLLHVIGHIFMMLTLFSCIRPESVIQSKSSGLTNIIDSPVVPPAPPVVAYPSLAQKLFSNESISPISPSTAAGSGLTFSISPSLPAGLSLNSTTGQIQGTPTVVSPLTTYTITATDSYGQSASAQVMMVTKPVFNVNTTSDLVDVNPGDGLCETASMNCSIRAAIQEANALGLGAKVMISDGTYPITATQLQATAEIDLIGNSRSGTILDGVNTRRILDATGTALTLKSLTITRGNGNDNANVKGKGAGVRFINTNGELVIDDVAFTNNVAVHTGQGYGGGGISFDGKSAFVSNSIFSGNEAYLSGGGSSTGGGGGAELVAQDITISQTTFLNNVGSSFGGGLYIRSTAGATLVGSKIIGNSVNVFGGWAGGVFFQGQGLTNVIARNLFQDNSGDYGSALRITSATAGLVENNTFHNNTGSLGSSSSAIHISNNDSINYFEIRNNTFSQNTFGIHGASVRLSLSNNIFFNNNGGSGSCFAFGSPMFGHSVVSNGGNIDDGNSCANLFSSQDLLNQNPLLTPGGPQNNGGSTNSILVQPGSPGLNFGVSAHCPSTDQRGTARPPGVNCTSGATQ